ncbi:TPA: hypothetical protein DEA21_04750 [Candidatus Uhrbacteria bacterium]|nr:hypothetical protein [Candidatus Uhrbacteria bacterium]HCU31230.1 hypothetical protein [Candidatus Uhrbacteria bacterium]
MSFRLKNFVLYHSIPLVVFLILVEAAVSSGFFLLKMPKEVFTFLVFFWFFQIPLFLIIFLGIPVVLINSRFSKKISEKSKT